MSIAGVVLYLAAATASETTPEDLGAVTSAIAFVDVCQSMREAPKYLKGASPEEQAIAGLTVELCKGMVQAVAATVTSTPNYTVQGARVCLNETLTTDQVIDEMRKMIDADRPAFAGNPIPRVDTSTAILGAIHRLSPCAPSK
ncbi:hypothetical protein [Stenotrophomonas sp. AB1(2024)]|uniref:hypothetical protein n=1 Tax=Stenotrophomonas sp. AB1(2024) TaxID=3132215 RepID=UPI00309588DA